MPRRRSPLRLRLLLLLDDAAADGDAGDERFARASSLRGRLTTAPRETTLGYVADGGRIKFFLDGDVVELVWQGFISQETVGGAPDELIRFLGETTPVFALFDAVGVTGFSADSRVPGGAILARLKERGVRRTFVVTDSSPIRMIGSAVALAVGLSIRFHESREAAHLALASERAALERRRPV